MERAGSLPPPGARRVPFFYRAAALGYCDVVVPDICRRRPRGSAMMNASAHKMQRPVCHRVRDGQGQLAMTRALPPARATFRAAELLPSEHRPEPGRDTHTHRARATSAELTEERAGGGAKPLAALRTRSLSDEQSKTQPTHVSRIYAKFGVSSRADFFRLVYSGGAGGR